MVISRVGQWIALLVVIFKQPTQSARVVPWASGVAPVFLHSGPWVLAFAAGAVLLAARSSSADFWSVVGGLAAAAGAIGFFGLLSLASKRGTPSKRRPLTPERLVVIRKRLFWLVSLSFAILMPTTAYLLPELPKSQREALAVLVVLPALVAGWLSSWFMWQYYGEELKRIEKLRQVRESQDGV